MNGNGPSSPLADNAAERILSNKGFKDLLDAIDGLQQVNVGNHELPKLLQIVVVGRQSVGKSSMLQALARNTITLPTGTGIVTRSPIRLSLRKDDKFQAIMSTPTGFERDLTEVMQKETAGKELRKVYDEALIDMKVGKGGVTDKAVQLRVSGPGMPNLTLVDLPGLRSEPTAEDPEDEKERVRSINAMVNEAAQNSNNIVVCIQSLQTAENPVYKDYQGILNKARSEKRLVIVQNHMTGEQIRPDLWDIVKEDWSYSHKKGVFVIRPKGDDESADVAISQTNMLKRAVREDKCANERMTNEEKTELCAHIGMEPD